MADTRNPQLQALLNADPQFQQLLKGFQAQGQGGPDVVKNRSRMLTQAARTIAARAGVTIDPNEIVHTDDGQIYDKGWLDKHGWKVGVAIITAGFAAAAAAPAAAGGATAVDGTALASTAVPTVTGGTVAATTAPAATNIIGTLFGGWDDLGILVGSTIYNHLQARRSAKDAEKAAKILSDANDKALANEQAQQARQEDFYRARWDAAQHTTGPYRQLGQGATIKLGRGTGIHVDPAPLNNPLPPAAPLAPAPPPNALASPPAGLSGPPTPGAMPTNALAAGMTPPANALAPQTAGPLVKMRAPTGEIEDVPIQEVAMMKAAGAIEVAA